MTTISADLLDTDDLAALLGCAPLTLKRWRGRGEGPPFVRCGPRFVRYPRAGVEQWLVANAHAPAPAPAEMPAK